MKTKTNSNLITPNLEFGTSKSELRTQNSKLTKPRALWSLSLAALGLTLMSGGAITVATNLQFNADVTLKETYDSNVYIQDITPNPAGVAAAAAAGLTAVQPKVSSFVTTIIPRLALDWKPSSAFSMLASYSPDINLYTSTEDEDYITHRGILNFGGKIEDATWELLNAETFIEGGKLGPTFARPNDIPAIGGIPLRDRRAAFFTRNSFRVTLPVQNWFIRPVASFYHHNFLTDQIYTPPAARATLYSYENYIDRQDVNGGLDFGYNVSDKTFAVMGYRYGAQNQYELLGVKSPFQCHYNRVLFGVEGNPWSWLKINLLVGPEFRQYNPGTPLGFNPNETLYYADAALSLLPTKTDTVTFRWTRFEQPAFSSFSVYQDIKYDLTWRHRFTDHFTAGAGFTLYIGNWQPPTHRDDWVYTPSVSATYSFNPHWTAEFSYSYDWVDSKVPASIEPFTAAHEYTRSLVALAVKWSL